MGRGKYWDRMAVNAKKKAGWRCESCERPGKLEAHHVRPIRDGGKHVLSNVRVLCVACHVALHRRERPRTPEREAWDALVNEPIEKVAGT